MQRIWWMPSTWLGIPMNFILHTVFDVKHTAEGFSYTRQEVVALAGQRYMHASDVPSVNMHLIAKGARRHGSLSFLKPAYVQRFGGRCQLPALLVC